MAQPILKLTVDHSLRLADGYSTAVASATLTNSGVPVTNTLVNFTTNFGNFSILTNSAGNASITVGPYPSTNYFMANLTADSAGINYAASTLNASVLFLPRNNLNLVRTPSSGIAAIGSSVVVIAEFYEDPINNIPAVNIPLTLQVYAPDLTPLGTYSNYTNSTGMAKFTFPLSQAAGDNTISVSNSDLGGLLMSTDFMGEGGLVSSIVLSTTPSSPIYADGSTSYLLKIWAKDSGGNPVSDQVINVYKNGDQLYTWKPTATNAYGYTELDLGSSTYVHTDLITANTTNYNGSIVSYVTNSINVTYQAGAPSQIQVFANPNIVATSDIQTPPGMPAVNQTSVIAMVLDQWGHSLDGQPVTISIANGNITLGNFTNPTGTTNDDGIFQSQFALGYNVQNTSGAVPIQAASSSLSPQLCYINYTNSPYLTLNSTITPRNNLSVNDTIDVKVTIRAIGWQQQSTTTRGGNYSFEMIFDSSGSMDWLSNTTYPVNGTPDSGTMAAIQYYYSRYTAIDSTDWHLIDTFNNPTKQTIQIMLSSNYRDYYNGSYYYLKVVGPTGTYATDPAEDSTNVAENSANENFVMITNATAGAYKIYGAFEQGSVSNTQYNAMVLTQPKRLGSKSDGMTTAARLAASQFIDTRYGDRIGIVWFNTSYGTAETMTLVNNTTRPSFNNSMLRLSANGGTDIGDGIQAARNDFNKSKNLVNGTKKIAIILTDGYSQYPDNDIAQAKQAAGENITIYTIGMGMPDSATLGAIANATGGTYNRTTNSSGLFAAYQSISNICGGNNLTDIITTNATLLIATNCSVAMGPDTRYIPGSAVITYQNGTSAQVEPVITDNGTFYSLSWIPGTFSFNDTWSVDYKLKILRNGSIQPITNQSYVSFNGINETFVTQNLTVLNNGTPTNTTSPLWITLTYPMNGFTIDTSSSHIDWFANYTVAGGNYYTYAQYRKVGDTTWNNMGIKGPYSSNTTFSIVWNTGLLQNGDYQVQAKAYDGTYTNQTVINQTSIMNQNGKIVLQ